MSPSGYLGGVSGEEKRRLGVARQVRVKGAPGRADAPPGPTTGRSVLTRGSVTETEMRLKTPIGEEEQSRKKDLRILEGVA